MLARDYPDVNCPSARTLELVGERWTLLIIRETLLGNQRFDAIQENLGVARNVLATRLRRLVEQQILERRAYRTAPVRHEYLPTQIARDLLPVILTMTAFGERYAPAAGGAVRIFRHRACGEPIDLWHVRCPRCSVDVGYEDLTVEPGPGFGGPAGRYDGSG